MVRDCAACASNVEVLSAMELRAVEKLREMCCVVGSRCWADCEGVPEAGVLRCRSVARVEAMVWRGSMCDCEGFACICNAVITRSLSGRFGGGNAKGCVERDVVV